MLARVSSSRRKEITEEKRRECARDKDEIVEALKAKIEEKRASGSTGCAWNAKTRYESFLEEERTKNNREEEKETSSRKIQSKRTLKDQRNRREKASTSFRRIPTRFCKSTKESTSSRSAVKVKILMQMRIRSF